MEDTAIIDLYWARDEQALAETQKKYGTYCRTVSWNILRNRQDAEECVNDAYIRAWNAMPPEKPVFLRAWLSCIVRNLSLTRLRANTAKRRGGGHAAAALEELANCVCDGPESRLQAAELSDHLDRFLRGLPEKDRCIILRRYWFLEPLGDIAGRYRLPVGSVKSSLFRTRKKLREYLEKEGLL